MIIQKNLVLLNNMSRQMRSRAGNEALVVAIAESDSGGRRGGINVTNRGELIYGGFTAKACEHGLGDSQNKSEIRMGSKRHEIGVP